MARKSAGSSLRQDIVAMKRERILSEAVELFYQNGYLPTNVEAIADRLGATKPFVYYHFQSKIDLLNEICERVMREALEATVGAASARLAPVEKLSLFVQDFTSVVLDRHEYVSIYFREQLNLPEEVNTRVMEMRKKIDHNLRNILREGKQAGDFRFENLAMASQIVAGMISYTFAWYSDSLHLSKEDIRRQMLDHVLLTVGVQPHAVAGAVGDSVD